MQLSFLSELYSLLKLLLFQVDAKKQRSAFPPNFVHSLDGSHMMMTALACRDAGLCFAGFKTSFYYQNPKAYSKFPSKVIKVYNVSLIAFFWFQGRLCRPRNWGNGKGQEFVTGIKMKSDAVATWALCSLVTLRLLMHRGFVYFYRQRFSLWHLCLIVSGTRRCRDSIGITLKLLKLITSLRESAVHFEACLFSDLLFSFIEFVCWILQFAP